MVNDGDRGVVLEYAGYTTLTTCLVVGILFTIAWLLSAKSVLWMFGLDFIRSKQSNRGKKQSGANMDGKREIPAATVLLVCNYIASLLFAAALMNLVRSAARRETLPPLTSMFLLWVTMIYLFGFFGIRFVVDEFGALETSSQLAADLKTNEFSEEGQDEGKEDDANIHRENQVVCIPDSVWCHTGRFLELEDLLELGKTCKAMNETVKLCLQSLEAFVAPLSREIGMMESSFLDLGASRTALQGTQRYMSILQQRSLDPTPPFEDKALQQVSQVFSEARATNIVEINLAQCRDLTDGVVADFLSSCKFQLKRVNLSGCCGIRENTLRALSENHRQSLVECNFGFCRSVPVGSFKGLLSQSPRLVRVKLRRTNVCDEAIAALLACATNLETLDVAECANLSDQAFEDYLSKTNNDNSGAQSNLRDIVLDSCSRITSRTTFRLFLRCPQLRSFSIRQLPFQFEPQQQPPNRPSTRRGVEEHQGVSTMRESLVSIDLSGTNITDTELEALAPLVPNLQVLALGATNITEQGLGTLAFNCPRLEHLELASCNAVSLQSISQISLHCQQVRALNLGGCSNLDDEDVVSIVDKFPLLEVLCLSGCEKVSYFGAERIHLLRPDLILFYGYDRFNTQETDNFTFQRAKSKLVRLVLGQSLGVAMVLRVASSGSVFFE